MSFICSSGALVYHVTQLHNSPSLETLASLFLRIEAELALFSMAGRTNADSFSPLRLRDLGDEDGSITLFLIGWQGGRKQEDNHDRGTFNNHVTDR